MMKDYRVYGSPPLEDYPTPPAAPSKSKELKLATAAMYAAVHAILDGECLPSTVPPPANAMKLAMWGERLRRATLTPMQKAKLELEFGHVYAAACELRRIGVSIPELAAYEAASKQG